MCFTRIHTPNPFHLTPVDGFWRAELRDNGCHVQTKMIKPKRSSTIYWYIVHVYMQYIYTYTLYHWYIYIHIISWIYIYIHYIMDIYIYMQYKYINIISWINAFINYIMSSVFTYYLLWSTIIYQLNIVNWCLSCMEKRFDKHFLLWNWAAKAFVLFFKAPSAEPTISPVGITRFCLSRSSQYKTGI